jgi:PAS domain S-box-containing protein
VAERTATLQQVIAQIQQEIRDRKRIEEKHRRAEQNLRTIVDNAHDAIFIHSADGQILDVNDRMLELYGVSRQQALALRIAEDCSGPDNCLEALSDRWQRVLAGEVLNFSWQAKRPLDGELFDVDVILKQIMLNEQPVVLAHVQDITALKASTLALEAKAEALAKALDQLQRTQAQLVQTEKMSSLGQLVAGIAHEINNPTAFIYGNITYVQEYMQSLIELVNLYRQYYPKPIAKIQAELDEIDIDFLIDDTSKLLTSMKSGTHRIQQIVQSLRSFSRMDEASYKTVDLHEGLDSALLILQSRLNATADRPAIQVVKRYGPLPPVECYAGELNQALMNILVNAVDAILQASPATPTLTLQTELNTDHVIVRIADNGTGISPDSRSRVFEPFFTTKPVGQGTGMGLAISYQIICDRHSGSLTCESTPGQGSEFTLAIPLRIQSTVAATPSSHG